VDKLLFAEKVVIPAPYQQVRDGNDNGAVMNFFKINILKENPVLMSKYLSALLFIPNHLSNLLLKIYQLKGLLNKVNSLISEGFYFGGFAAMPH